MARLPSLPPLAPAPASLNLYLSPYLLLPLHPPSLETPCPPMPPASPQSSSGGGRVGTWRSWVGPWVPPGTFNKVEILLSEEDLALLPHIAQPGGLHNLDSQDLASYPIYPAQCPPQPGLPNTYSKCFIVLLRHLQILKITQPGPATMAQCWEGGQEGGLSVKAERAEARQLEAWSSALHFHYPSKAKGRAARPQGPPHLLLPLLLRPSLREHLSSSLSLSETQPCTGPFSFLSHSQTSSSGL